MTRKTDLNQDPQLPHEIGAGSPSTQQPPATPEPINTREIHERVRPTTGSHHEDDE